MKQFLNSRLKVHHELLSRYDILDKEFPVDFDSLNTLKFVTVSYHTNSLNNLTFTVLFDKEFSTYQKVGLQFKRKTKFKVTNFLLTLRSLLLYMYLELLIHSYSFTRCIIQNQNYFSFVLHRKLYNSFLPVEFLSKLNDYNSNSSDTLVSLFFKFPKNNNSDTSLTYYFISAVGKIQ